MRTAGVTPGFSLGELRVYRQPRVAVIGEAIMPPSGAITPAKLDAFMEAGWRSVDAASAKAEQLRAAMPHDLRAKHAILPALAAGTVVSTAHQVTDDE